MEIEIRTTIETWITKVDDEEFANRPPGAAAASVSDRIQAGEPIEVRVEINDGDRHAQRSPHMAVFNPAQVVTIVERVRPRGGSGVRYIGSR